MSSQHAGRSGPTVIRLREILFELLMLAIGAVAGLLPGGLIFGVIMALCLAFGIYASRPMIRVRSERLRVLAAMIRAGIGGTVSVGIGRLWSEGASLEVVLVVVVGAVVFVSSYLLERGVTE